MNTEIKSILKIGLLVIVMEINTLAFSQTDSTQISYTQENADSSDFNFKRKYMYLDINMKEENNMISIGIVPSSMLLNRNIANEAKNEVTFGLVSKYDKRIYKSIVSYAEINSIYSYSHYSYSYIDRTYTDHTFSTSFNLGYDTK
jgi:hypothetical protein